MTSLLHRPRVVLVVALAVGLTGCASAPIDKPLPLDKVDKGPGTLTEARQYLQGHWTLVSMDLYPPGQPPIQAAATGTMVYDDFANMSVDLQLTPETTRLAERIGIPATNGVVRTSGRTVIDVGNHSVSYVFDGQPGVRPPTHPLDTNLPRYWEVSGNTLTLRTKDDKGTVLSVTTWKKD